MTSGKLKKR